MKNIAILAFVPVIHQGYVEFFRGQSGDIWIFGDELINSFVHLTRDLRVIRPNETRQALQSLLPGRIIKIARAPDFPSWQYQMIVMPEDEVSQDVAEKYLTGRKIQYIPIFLRWNKLISFKENVIPKHRQISKDKFHQNIMGEAFIEARKSSDWWRQIGALVIKDKNILLKSHNHHLPTDFHLSVNGDPRSNFDAGEHQEIFTSIHAEAEMIAKAAEKGLCLTGTDLYSTTFPCPNCARLIGTAGIKRVYYSKGYSLLDAEKILNHFGVEIILVN